MANSNKYELILNFKDLEQVVENKQGQVEQDNADKILNAWKTFALTQIAEPFINTALSIHTTELTLTGRQQLQERWELQKRIAMSPVTVAGLLAGGKALGVSLGVGGGVGIAIASVLKVTYDALKYATESARTNVSKTKEYANIRQTQTRAGWSFNKSRGGQ